MALLRRGVDLSVIALWLGHESTETTQIYLHADMQLKERALAHASPSGLNRPGSGRRTPCSRSWRVSDYADSRATQNERSLAKTRMTSRARGIIRESA